MQQALRAKIMERRTESKAPPGEFAQWLVSIGKIEALRDTLLRLVARAGIALTEDERARVLACDDVATLDRWVENVLGAKTAADVFA